MSGPYSRVKCSHDGCIKQVRRGASTGLCVLHYHEKRSAHVRYCEDCKIKLSWRASRRNGGKVHSVCKPCRHIRDAKTCTECGAKYCGKARLSGKCTPCVQKQPSIRVQIGEDRLADYYVLRNRGFSQVDAVTYINSGQRVLRKFGEPRVTITTLQAVRMVGEALAISPQEILSESRFTSAVDCRAVIVAVMHRQGVSDGQIGKRLNRDHTSILHLRHTFSKRVAKRPVLGRLVERILEAA